MNTQSNQHKHNHLYYNVYPTFAKYSIWLENNWDALTQGLSSSDKYDARDKWKKSLSRFDEEARLGNDTLMWETLIDHWHEMPFDSDLSNAPQEWVDFYESADELYKNWSTNTLSSAQYYRPQPFLKDDKLSEMCHIVYPQYALYRHWIADHFDAWVQNEIRLGHSKEWTNKSHEPDFFLCLRNFDTAFHAADVPQMYEWLLGQFLECNFHANPTSKPQEWSNYYHAVEQLHGKWTTKSVDKTNVEGKK